MIRQFAFTVLVCLHPHGGALAQSAARVPEGVTFTAAIPAADMLQIDGDKNPELIPQWSAWGFAFRVIAGGPGTLPKSVHEVVSKEETALVVRESQAAQKIERDCQDRVVQLHALLGRESNAALDSRLRRLTVDCRRATLDVRDRLLAVLNPAGAAALRLYVESTKAGTSLSIRKKDLARFLEPE